MSVVSIHEDKERIKVKDNLQIVKLQGPKGDPGPKGEPGKDGKSFTYDMFTSEQLEALKGPRGDIGPQGPPGAGANVDLSAYATKADADNAYLKKVDLRNYLTMLGDPKYALKTELSTYLKAEAASNNYVSKPFAENTYATKSSLENYMKTEAASNVFLSKLNAENTYLSKTAAESAYAKKTDLNNYLTATAAADAYLTKTDANTAYAKKTDLNNYLTNTVASNTYVSKTDADTTYAKKSELSDYVKKAEVNQYTSSAQPELTFTLAENGDLFVDIAYSSNPTNNPTNNTTNIAETKTYDIVWGVAQAGAPGAGRGYLEFNPATGFGKLHLDMKITTAGSGNGGVLCTLPANAPVPTRLLEVTVDANNNSVYVEPNSRNIKGWGVAGNNKRYILDIVGFWKEVK